MRGFLLALVLCISCNAFAQTLEQDRLALVALYNSANGVHWSENDWVVPGTPGDNPCGWVGVACEGGRVTSLAVGGIELTGTVPAEIGNLTALKVLIMSGGGVQHGMIPLTGALPLEFGNLVNLEVLQIHGNRFDETNIEVLGNLVKLKELSLTPFWPIPSSIGNLINLETFTLHSSGIEGQTIGSLPSTIGNLTKLKRLDISSIGLTGVIPPEIGNLTDLEILTLNGMEGSIPTSIGNLTKLTQLHVVGLRSGGTIPSQIGSLANLIWLELRDSELTGTIPPEINNLVEANEINLTGNYLKGPLPNLSALKSNRLFVRLNSFNFDGIEGNINRFYEYSDQRKLPLLYDSGILSVNAGGTLANNTYRWYLYDDLVASNVGVSTYEPLSFGRYRVEVTNSIVPNLVLISENFERSLPVTLVSFEGKRKSNQTNLTWKTTSETNNKGFEIERSADARTFEKIGFVDGNGATKEENTYHYTDLQPLATGYYRLKQLDYDGKFEYSRVIAVRGDGVEMKIYPNPAGENLTISGAQADEDVRVYNNAGRLLLKQNVGSSGQVNIKALPNGIYNVRIGESSKKLLIQK